MILNAMLYGLLYNMLKTLVALSRITHAVQTGPGNFVARLATKSIDSVTVPALLHLQMPASAGHKSLDTTLGDGQHTTDLENRSHR